MIGDFVLVMGVIGLFSLIMGLMLGAKSIWCRLVQIVVTCVLIWRMLRAVLPVV